MSPKKVHRQSAARGGTLRERTHHQGTSATHVPPVGLPREKPRNESTKKQAKGRAVGSGSWVSCKWEGAWAGGGGGGEGTCKGAGAVHTALTRP